MFSDKELYDSIGRGVGFVMKAMAVLLVLGIVAVLLVGWGLWWLWSYFT
ncbi:MAG: hypothetical protein ABW277_07675 [Longimicrobiaceae bacterium]